MLPRALKIGSIALAEELAYPLITVEERQTQIARLEGITIKPITDFSAS